MQKIALLMEASSPPLLDRLEIAMYNSSPKGENLPHLLVTWMVVLLANLIHLLHLPFFHRCPPSPLHCFHHHYRRYHFHYHQDLIWNLFKFESIWLYFDQLIFAIDF